VTGPEQHAATIREALRSWNAYHPPLPGSRAAVAHEALDALVALADDNEGLRFLVDAKQALLEGCQRALEAAEERASQWERRAKDEEDQKRTASKAYLDMQERASQLEHERDQLLTARENAYERLGEARREADQLRAALERAEATLVAITDIFVPGIDTWENTDAVETLASVRAALAGVQATSIVGTPGVVDCVDHRPAARCQRDHESGRCICRAGVQAKEPA